MVKLDITVREDNTDEEFRYCASLESQDEIIAGYGKDPYGALRDLINELEFQHEYFRPD